MNSEIDGDNEKKAYFRVSHPPHANHHLRQVKFDPHLPSEQKEKKMRPLVRIYNTSDVDSTEIANVSFVLSPTMQ